LPPPPAWPWTAILSCAPRNQLEGAIVLFSNKQRTLLAQVAAQLPVASQFEFYQLIESQLLARLELYPKKYSHFSFGGHC
jgi:hypothetical protein